MKKPRMLFALKGFCIFFLIFWGSVSCVGTKTWENGRVVGGPCRYKTYPGTAEVVSVQKTKTLNEDGSSGDDGYDVRFVFHAETASEEAYAQAKEKTHRLLLINGSYPRVGFLKKYGIEADKVFSCHLKVIVKGTCTPVLFNFPTIDLTDYESNR